jgi:DEAD/DEAH box helicase domain-containing protein
VAVNMLPLLAMCDRLDVGGIVDSSNTGTPTMFLYDRYPGGLGFAEKGYELFGSLMEQCLTTIEKCPCEEGCPSCVGLPVTQPAQQSDLDLGRGYPIPDKDAALVLLTYLLGREPYVPARRKRGRRGGPRRESTEAAAGPAGPELPRQLSVSEQVAHRLRKGRRHHVGL